MKTIFNIFLAIIFLLQGFNNIAQPIDTLGNYFTYYDHMTEYFHNKAEQDNINYYEVDGWKQFMRWSLISENRHDEYGNMTPYAEALAEYYSAPLEDTLENLPVWEYIGHEGIYKMQNGNYWTGVGQGNINCIWVDKDTLNHIIAGGNYGSLWRTNDGGNKWFCISDTEPLLDGFRSIEVDQNDHNKIYVVQGFGNYSNGLFSTTDGGTTWTNNKVFGPWFSWGSGFLYPGASERNRPRKWIINPTNDSIMFLLTWGKVLRSVDKGENWDVLIDSSSVYDFWTYEQSFNDIEFDPVDPSIIYVSGPNIFRIANNGSTPNDIEDITSSVLNWSNNPPGYYKVLIGTTPAFPEKIWFAVNTEKGGDDALVYYDKILQNFNLIKAESNLLDFHKMQCEISPVDSGHIFIGGVHHFLYMDELGYSVQICKHDVPTNWTHVDVRDAKYLVDENDNEVIIVGNDGSVFRTDYNRLQDDWNWTYLGNDSTDGIQNCHLHGFDCSNTINDVLFEGLQDMATAIQLNGKWYGHWANGTGDGGPGIIDKTDPDYMYISGWNSPAQFDRTTNGGLNWTTFFSNHGHAAPPVILNPNNPNELFIGDKIDSANQIAIYKFDSARTSSAYYHLLSIDFDKLGAGDLKLNQIAICDTEDDVIYACTERYWPGWAGQQAYEKSLYKTTDGGQHWIDITINLKDTVSGLDAISNQPITGIAINPWDADEVWTCFGTVSYSPDANVNKKVYHSTDGGQTWEAMANGLPEKIPANELYFDKKGNTLYLATDVGLYYFDQDEELWYNIINNGPSTYILQIRFNYALNKIRIGTHGRGIWQADIPCFNRGDDITISTDTTWDTPKHIYGNIHIENGAALTITNEVYMAEGKIIFVEQGAKLDIDGGLITNMCGNYWFGIEVFGTPSANQNPIDQGWVKIQNGGTIMNSQQGVVAALLEEDVTDGDLTPNPGYTGGIIQASDARFINNQTAVQFYDYRFNSVSYFNNCEFKLNWNYFGNAEPENYMIIRNMTAVDVIFCDFINEKTSTAQYTGILSQNSTIFIEGDCASGTIEDCDEWNKGNFNNLEYGVCATAVTSTRYIDIQHTDFTDNYRGVFIGAITGAVVTNNNFQINTPYIENGGYGLYLDHSTGYKVEENNFYHEGATQTGVGLVVNQSGGEPNEIYRNWFTNLQCGMDIQGENRGSTTGLVLKCNQYEETVMDKIITWDEPKITKSAGIAASQGSSSSNPEAMAGNLFQIDGQTPNGDFDDILDEANSITYYYPLNSDNDDVRPVDVTANVSPTPINFNPQWTYEKHCPPDEAWRWRQYRGRVTWKYNAI